MTILRIPAFGTGVNLSGAPDTRAVTDVLQADAMDLLPRGALVQTSDVEDFTSMTDERFSAEPLFRVFHLDESSDPATCYGVGQGYWYDGISSALPAYLLCAFVRDGSIGTAGGEIFAQNAAGDALGNPVAPVGEGIVVTTARLAGSFAVQTAGPQVAPFPEYTLWLVNLGAREGFAPRTAPGLYVVAIQQTMTGSGQITSGVPYPIVKFQALGMGRWTVDGDYFDGSYSQQLYPRGIIAYNNHVFAWGFDAADTVNGDGPTRVMFSNLGVPVIWGNDNQGATGTDRAFTDSDAIVLGGSGEVIRAAIVWNGKLWFFTNQQGHYIAGYGRDSFITDGATAVLRSYNVIGPKALIEGPDRQLYGVCDQGLWSTADGNAYDPLFRRLVDFRGRSEGYWDLIWFDANAASADYPGKTNRDLVWLAVDHDREQVLVGIPFCDAATGVGRGTDTVIVKYHPRTGGFTRQVFEDQYLTAPGYFRAYGQQPPTRFLGLTQQTPTPTADENVQFFGFQDDPEDSPILSQTTPTMTFGVYAPFGPDGDGVVRTVYLTLAWENTSGLQDAFAFTITTTVDDATVDTFTLYLNATEPLVTPVAGDYWVDLAPQGSDIGNEVASGDIPARGGYLLKVRMPDDTWLVRPGLGGSGRRVTIPLPLTRVPGTRMTVAVTGDGVGRFTVEGLALDAASGKAAS